MDMASNVPVIDFTSGQDIPVDSVEGWVFNDGHKNLAEKIIEAFRTTGFICLISTGLNQSEIDTLIHQVKVFFQCSTDEKLKYTKGVMSNVGWTDIARENLNPTVRKFGDYKETFNFQPKMDKSGVPESMSILYDWWNRMYTLTHQVLILMALGLGLEDPYCISRLHRFGDSDNETAIRVNFYPKTADKDLCEGQTRCSEHTDYGSVTLLVQDSHGLEVMNRQTKQYESVSVPDGGVVVNVGDMMQQWTSDDLVANLHRVLVAKCPSLQAADRVSIPFFAMPDQSTTIKCLLGRNKYQSVLMKDWLKMKIDSAFKERQTKNE